MSEQVLVVPTRFLREAGLFQGLSTRIDHYLPQLLAAERLLFLPRDRAEVDPEHKQIIPYVVLRHGADLFHYTRGQGGGEKRLRARRSVGVGGHINPCDGPSTAGDIYRQGLLRELAEEIELATPYRETCLGLINDDSTEVGKVHLGVVHVFDLDAANVFPRDPQWADAGFSPACDLSRCAAEFETWSQIVLNALESMESGLFPKPFTIFPGTIP